MPYRSVRSGWVIFSSQENQFSLLENKIPRLGNKITRRGIFSCDVD